MIDNIKDKIGTGIGWIIGGAIGYYTGLNLLIPLVLASLSGWLANKVIRSPLSKAMIPAFAVQNGQMLWMLSGILSGYPANILEPLLVIVVLVWMLIRPSLLSVILLLIYQVIGFIDSMFKFLSYSIGTPQHKALLVHIIIRLVAVFLMFTGLREIRKQKNSVKT